MDPQELLLTAARAFAVYVLMLVVIRALGKRTVGNFSAFDLLVALMLGEIVDEIIYGDVRFDQGTIAIVTLAALTYADSWMAFKSRFLQQWLEGTPTVVIRDGEYDRDGMRRERMSEQDVLAMLRHQGVQDMREVHLAVVETDGEVSVLRQTWADPAQRGDVKKDENREREATLDSRDVPPASKRTDSRHALSTD